MKKCLFFGLALLIALSGVLVGCSCEKDGGGSTVGIIQVPDGPKIKVVFSGPPELEVNWEKIGMAADGFQVQLIGTLKNVSDQAVKFSEIGFLFDGQQVAFIPGRTLNPEETMRIAKGFPGYSENTKVLEVKIKGFEIIGDSATTPEPTKSTLTYKKNPKTPGETIIAFFGLANEGKYEEAAELVGAQLSPAEMSDFKNSWQNEMVQGRKIIAVKITEERIEGDLVMVSGVLYFDDGDEGNFSEFKLKKTDGKWVFAD